MDDQLKDNGPAGKEPSATEDNSAQAAEYLDQDMEKTVELSPDELPGAESPISSAEETLDDAKAEQAGEPESAAVPPESSEPAVDKQPKLRWDIMFLLLLTCITLIRLGYLYVVPLDLSPDESYYWDWSRQLDLGYYDKPPLIAWLISVATSWLGVSSQAVRMPALVFGVLSLAGIYLCGRRMFSAEVGFWAVVAWLATPAATLLGLTAGTDSLLVGIWSLTLYTLWRALEPEGAKSFWWLLTLLLMGLGNLSDPMMLLFPLLLFCYLIFSPDRNRLFSRWPWFCSIGSLLILLPPLWWNITHNWVTLRSTLSYFSPAGGKTQNQIVSFGAFITGQLGLVTPITWLLALLLSLALLLKLLRWSRQTCFLFMFGSVGLLIACGFNFRQPVSANVPLVFYPAALLLLVGWAKQQLSAGFFDSLRRWFSPAIKLGIVLTLVAYLLPFALQLTFLPLGKKDPTNQFKGWQTMAQQVDEVLQQQPRPQQTLLISPRRNYLSGLAFYLPGHPATYHWPGFPPKQDNQYDLWPGPQDKLGQDALILTDRDELLPEQLTAAFENIVELETRSLSLGAAGERSYRLWRGENLLNWPEQP